MTRATTAVYVYCIVRAARRPSLARVPAGIPGGGQPELHAVAPSLWLVAAAVPLALYGPSHLESRLRDLDWVANAAVAHEAVIEHVARVRGATVIPMKLFTMFSSADTAVRHVSARKAAIQRTMRRIANADEWGVRVFRQAGAAPAGRTAARPSSGTAFLQSRKQARDATALARTTAADAAQHAFIRLRRFARDARARETRREAGSNPPILDAAFLVAVSSRRRFTAEARIQATALARAGADLVLTGPWPAYTFVVSGGSA